MDRMTYYRNAINEIDGQIRALLLARFDLVQKIGNYKEKQGIPFYDSAREEAILRALAKDLDVSLGEAMQTIWRTIFSEGRKQYFIYQRDRR